MSLTVSKMALATLLASGGHRGVDAVQANPIRKVVNMLQAMQEKVKTEGEAEDELMQKFVCYCKNNKGALETTIADAEAKGPEVRSAIEEAEGEKTQLDEDLKAHKADRETAKSSKAEAISIRKKQASEFAANKAEAESNTGALKKAIDAVEKGMGGAFLQTGAAQALRQVVKSQESMIDADRQTVMAFLSGASDYSPQSGEITGILKQIHETMTGSLKEDTAAEEDLIKKHEALVAAKKKEINALTKAIEEKTVRAGEVAVNIVNMKDDLGDTLEALEKDQAFLKELAEGCGNKESEWSERQKVRGEELLALAETIKLLNDDDALELFKKAVPQKAESFMQMGRSMEQVRARALAAVRQAGRTPGIELIALALNSKTSAFEKVQAMIDEMVVNLKAEQDGDDKKKEYCTAELDSADDKKKSLERTISDEESAIDDAKEGIATITDELKALSAGIKQLDKNVAQATEQRKEEDAAYKELMALDSQAKELLGIAKNRLNKFYNPKLYVEPPKKELTREEAIYQTVDGVPLSTTPAPAFVQLAARTQHEVAPPPPPETFDAYNKKGEDSNSVIAMVDLLVKDLALEMTEAETNEKIAQKDYEAMLAGAKEKRAADSKSISEKEGAKADLEQALESHTDGHASATKELAATAEYIAGLHGDCDWLHQNYDARKGARAGEVESLKNAKAVLAGADYSLVQLHERTQTRHLRG